MVSEKSKPSKQNASSEYSPRWLLFLSRIKRAKKYVDGNVQGGLLSRITTHWAMFFFTTAFTYIVVQAITTPTGVSFLQSMQKSLTEFSLLALLTVTLVPVFLLDTLRFSNRFAGPIVRLRRFLHELGENGEAPLLKFRDDDFWMDVAAKFNVCRERIYRQRKEIERLQALLSETDIKSKNWSDSDRGNVSV